LIAMHNFTIITGAASGWPNIPLIYEAGGYDRAAAGRRAPYPAAAGS